MEDIEKQASMFLPDSEINKINNNAGISSVKVDMHLYTMIERSIHFSQMSDGAFDITIGPITSLWSIGTKQSIPSKNAIQEKLKLVSYKNIVLDHSQKTVFLTKPGMHIDLGGAAKAYAVAEGIKTLRDHSVQSAMVQIGGEIGFLGRRPGSKFWNIGIQHPRDVDPDSETEYHHNGHAIKQVPFDPRKGAGFFLPEPVAKKDPQYSAHKGQDNGYKQPEAGLYEKRISLQRR